MIDEYLEREVKECLDALNTSRVLTADKHSKLINVLQRVLRKIGKNQKSIEEEVE